MLKSRAISQEPAVESLQRCKVLRRKCHSAENSPRRTSDAQAQNSWTHPRFCSIRNFRASSSRLDMPCRAIAVAKYNAGTCLILLPCSTLRRSFCTSGSAPTFKNTSYASGMGRVFSIRPCLTNAMI